jgi:hypothetical protein
MTEVTNISEAESQLRAAGAEADAEHEPAAAQTAPPAETAPAVEPERPAETAREQAAAPETDAGREQALAAQHLAARAERDAFHRDWWETVRREVEASPELKDERSEIARTLQAVLRETPLFSMTPDGFRHAAAFAKARHAAAGLPALHAKIDALSKENERLVKLTSVTGSGPTRLAGDADRDFSERDLRRMAAELDTL